MPASMPAPSLHILVEPLTADAFAPFGTLIENSLPLHVFSSDTPLPLDAVRANQGSAVKIIDVTHMTNFYGSAPSKQAAKAVMNMFVCSPRPLRQEHSNLTTLGLPISSEGAVRQDSADQAKSKYLFDVKILERHPFTPQTFIPLGLDARDSTICYLVIVAPTLPAAQSPTAGGWRRPIDNFLTRARASLEGSYFPDQTFEPASHTQRKGSGPPGLATIRAFLANGSQAVTYGAGTWHAPMVVLGTSKVDFVVVQYANGVALEDCQEVELHPEEGGQGLSVAIEVAASLTATVAEEAPTSLKAKL